MEERSAMENAIEELKGLIMDLAYGDGGTEDFNAVIDINNRMTWILAKFNEVKEHDREERLKNCKKQIIIGKLSKKLEELGVSVDEVI